METLFSLDSEPTEKPSVGAREIVSEFNRLYMVQFYTARLQRATTDDQKHYYTERLQSWAK
jgi:hypothetical protein